MGGDEGGEDVTKDIAAAVRQAILKSALDGLAARLDPLDATEPEIEALADEAVKWARKQPSG